MVLCPVGAAFCAIFKAIWFARSFLAEMTAKITLLASSTGGSLSILLVTSKAGLNSLYPLTTS